MTIEEIERFRMYLNSEAIGIETKLINPDNLSVIEFKAFLLRYIFLFRLKAKLSQYCLNEYHFYDEYKANYGSSRIDLESEIIYNKYFASRTNRNYEDVLESISKQWYSVDNAT